MTEYLLIGFGLEKQKHGYCQLFKVTLDILEVLILENMKKTEEITKYNNLSTIFVTWVEYINAEKKKRIILLTVAYFIFTVFLRYIKSKPANIYFMIFYLVIEISFLVYYLMGIISIIKISITPISVNKYINMTGANAKRYRLIPYDTNSIMLAPGDIDTDYFEPIEASINRGIYFSSPYLYVTDEYLISRSATSLKFNPVIIPKNVIEKISFCDMNIFKNGWLAKYDCIDIFFKKNEDTKQLGHIKRVVATKNRHGMKDVQIYTNEDPLALKLRYIDLTKKR